MGFKSTILVVADVLKSRKLYEDILECNVVEDFGIYNVGFNGGLGLYKKSFFSELTGKKNIIQGANNLSVYFEFDDINEIEGKIKKSNFEFIHTKKEQPWGQNIFRFYDYDYHIIEIAESMKLVLKRLYDSGLTIQEIATKTGYTETSIIKEIEKITTIKDSPISNKETLK